MSVFANSVKFFPNAGSNTDWVWNNTVPVVGFNSPTTGNMTNGATYSYRAQTLDLSQWEEGAGVWNSTTGTLARTTVYSNSSATGLDTPGQSGAGTKITFLQIPIIGIVALVADVPSLTAAVNTFTGEIISGTRLTITNSNPTLRLASALNALWGSFSNDGTSGFWNNDIGTSNFINLGGVTSYRFSPGFTDWNGTTSGRLRHSWPAIAGAATNITWRATSGTPAFQGESIVTVTTQRFTANGTYTPTAGMVFAIVECVGGGAQGGGVTGTAAQLYAAGGGGSGGYSRSLVTAATIGASKAVVIGAAGSGAAAGNNNGTAGGDTTLGATIVVAKGGSGGTFANATNLGQGGAGGVAGTGDVVAAGMPGGSGFFNSVNTTISLPSGFGGTSYFGGGAKGVASASVATAGAAAGNYGSGGSGAQAHNTAATAAGGAGSAGYMIITEFCNA